MGYWRKDTGKKGGGKGWCNDCLITEEFENQGLFKDENGFHCFNCRSCI